MLPLHRRVVKACRLILGTEPIGLSDLTPRQVARSGRRQASLILPAASVHIIGAGGGGGGVGGGGSFNTASSSGRCCGGNANGHFAS